MKKIVVLISGYGANLQAIIDACESRYIDGEVVGVFSNRADAFGLQRAKSAGIFHRTFLRSDYADNLAMDRHIADEIDNLGADLIVLAGYMKILTALCGKNSQHSPFFIAQISWAAYLPTGNRSR